MSEKGCLFISTDDYKLTKRFDYLMYTIQYAYLEKKPYSKPKSRVRKILRELIELTDRKSYEKVYGDKPLLELLARITGMDREVAKKEGVIKLFDNRFDLAKEIISIVDKINDGFLSKT